MKTSVQAIANIAVICFVLVGLGVSFTTGRSPHVAPAGSVAGRADPACANLATRGADDHAIEIKTNEGLRVLVRTPSDYQPTRAYPLLVVYPPAGFDRHASEHYYGLTTEATRRGMIVAYSNHVGLSRKAVSMQAGVASAVAVGFCIERDAITFLGHSDGGSMAEGIPATVPASIRPHVIVASAAGIQKDDLVPNGCPVSTSVLIIHNSQDRLFPDFGRGTAAYWAACAGCQPQDLSSSASVPSCRTFAACLPGIKISYCDTESPHSRWPSMNEQILEFIASIASPSPSGT
jgi:polyhydroxybutyrate depolymerase